VQVLAAAVAAAGEEVEEQPLLRLPIQILVLVLEPEVAQIVDVSKQGGLVVVAA
jgi:hypothetical protein